ncbi:MAG: hypothetical protein Q8P67_24040, partial [archaeon]|nr:hypothetical protein [archaeon]
MSKFNNQHSDKCLEQQLKGKTSSISNRRDGFRVNEIISAIGHEIKALGSPTTLRPKDMTKLLQTQNLIRIDKHTDESYKANLSKRVLDKCKGIFAER